MFSEEYTLDVKKFGAALKIDLKEKIQSNKNIIYDHLLNISIKKLFSTVKTKKKTKRNFRFVQKSLAILKILSHN